MHPGERLPAPFWKEDDVSSYRVRPHAERGLGLSKGSNTSQCLEICALEEWLGQQFHRHDL
jgi:hypothetical protein